jgi:hypothetical protein
MTPAAREWYQRWMRETTNEPMGPDVGWALAEIEDYVEKKSASGTPTKILTR